MRPETPITHAPGATPARELGEENNHGANAPDDPRKHVGLQLSAPNGANVGQKQSERQNDSECAEQFFGHHLRFKDECDMKKTLGFRRRKNSRSLGSSGSTFRTLAFNLLLQSNFIRGILRFFGPTPQRVFIFATSGISDNDGYLSIEQSEQFLFSRGCSFISVS
jgi:hypothetical protein